MITWTFKVEVNSGAWGPNPWCIEEVSVKAKSKEQAEAKIKKRFHNTHGVIKSFIGSSFSSA